MVYAAALLSLGSTAAMSAAGPPLSRCADHAPSAAADPVRSGVLSRGVNMTDALRPAVPMAQVRRDLAAVRGLGLRHVRLPVSPSWVLEWPGAGLPDARLQRLDAVVCAAVAQGLAVILDAHPEDELALNDAAGPAAIDGLAAAWTRLAERYAVVPPGLMVFEALNEPGLTDAGRWAADRRILLDRIRRAAPRHTVLLTASPSSTAAALAGSEPEDDRRVAYVFHFYSPMVFTHQGAEWADPDLYSIRGLAYPASEANVERARAGAVPPLRPALDRYAFADGSPEAIRGQIALAAQWRPVRRAARGHRVRCVRDRGSRVTARLAARRAQRPRGERHRVDDIGDRGGFGIDAGLVRPCSDNGSTRIALGLCPAAPPSR